MTRSPIRAPKTIPIHFKTLRMACLLREAGWGQGRESGRAALQALLQIGRVSPPFQGAMLNGFEAVPPANLTIIHTRDGRPPAPRAECPGARCHPGSPARR